MAQETRHAGGKEDRKKEIKIGSRGSHSKGGKTEFLIKKTPYTTALAHSLSSRLVSGQKIRTGESLKTQNLEN